MALVPCLALCVPWGVCSDLFSQVAVSEETQDQCSPWCEILIPHPHRLSEEELLQKCSLGSFSVALFCIPGRLP